MKLYVLDDNGAVVFEFSDVDAVVLDLADRRNPVPQATLVKRLLEAALRSLQRREK